MTHSDYIEKRDEILRKYGEAVDPQGYEVPELKEAAQAIDALVLEVIGEDIKTSDYRLNMGVPHNPPSHTTRTNLYRGGVNDTKAEQRNIVQGDK